MSFQHAQEILSFEPAELLKTPSRQSNETTPVGHLTFVLSSADNELNPATIISFEKGPVLERLTAYVNAALRELAIERLDDGSWYSAIPSCEGVWANSNLPGECLDELREVLLDWLLLKISSKDGDIPVLAGIDLNQV
jgi:predicted RNase H-like HicB family nuclease